jgi:polysaccharide biosynthesis protein VpsM
VGPKTAVFATASGRRSRFDETAPGAFDRGATTMRYLLGSRWQATAKTHGDVRVGYIDRDPRDPGRDDFRRIDWRAELGWAPRTVTGLALATGRSSRESYINTVDFLDIRYVNLTWTEQWTQRAQTQLAASYQETDFVGSARKDELVGFSLGGEYLLTRDLKLRGYALNGHRDSPATFANYERSYVYLGIRYSR